MTPAINWKRIRGYSFSTRDRLFFDTNIWLAIHGPQDPEKNWPKIYSRAYQDILNARCAIFVDVLVLSEFINRIARFHHDLWQDENNLVFDFKEYRQTADFQPVAQEIEMLAHAILQDSQPVESGLTRLDQKAILAMFATGRNDFNDLVIADLCQKNGFTLVTHDADYRAFGNLPILTANPTYFQNT